MIMALNFHDIMESIEFSVKYHSYDLYNVADGSKYEM